MIKLINKKGIAEKLSCSVATLNKLIKSGSFPEGKKDYETGPMVWDEGVVDAWMIMRYDLDRELPKIGQSALSHAKKHAEHAKLTVA